MANTNESYEESEETELNAKKPLKEVTVVQDQGMFQHDTGDVYDGFFEAKKKDKSIKMHGPGVYTTAEGDIYSGTWENDKLSAGEEVNITFVDGSKYEGHFKEWSYSGSGKYNYPDGSSLMCEFTENCPVGPLTLTDPNGHLWLGKADNGFAWFEPVNHFYDMLEKKRDLISLKHKRNKVTTNSSTTSDVVPVAVTSAESPELKQKAKPKSKGKK